MIYYIIFIILFSLSILAQISGKVVECAFNNYMISIDLHFFVIICVIALFLLIILIRSLSFIVSIFISIKNRKIDRDRLLILEAFFSMDLDNIENVNKLLKYLDTEDDTLLLVKILNAAKLGNYNLFSNNLTELARKNRNLSLLLSHKLIAFFKRDRVVFQGFIEYCSNAIRDKTLLLLFQIENFILKNDWYNAVLKLKEAIKLNIFLPFNHREMLAVFYCAMAREFANTGNYRSAIKYVFKAQSYCITFCPINYLKIEFYIKLGNTKKASLSLEAEYSARPTPQIAQLYANLHGHNAKRLYSQHANYYFSHNMLALLAMNSGKYDLAEQHLNTALTKANYLSIYSTMVRLKILLHDYDQAIYWLDQINSNVLPDPIWRCKICYRGLEQWNHRCLHCDNFNCITII